MRKIISLLRDKLSKEAINIRPETERSVNSGLRRVDRLQSKVSRLNTAIAENIGMMYRDSKMMQETQLQRTMNQTEHPPEEDGYFVDTQL